MSSIFTKCLAKNCSFEGSCSMFASEGVAAAESEISLSTKCICGCYKNQHQREREVCSPLHPSLDFTHHPQTSGASVASAPYTNLFNKTAKELLANHAKVTCFDCPSQHSSDIHHRLLIP